jgi:hypothetical protein
MLKYFAATLTLLLLAAPQVWAGDAPITKPIFAKPRFSVPITSATVGEGKQVLEQLSMPERQVLQSDGVVVSHQKAADADGEIKGIIKAYIIVKQPREKAFKILQDTTKQASYLPHLVTSKRVSGSETTEKTEFLVKVAFISVHTRVDHQWWPDSSRMAWVLDPGYKNDLKAQVGFYNFYSLDANTTLLEFGTLLETSPLVPGFVQDALTRRDLPEALGNVKKFVDSGGTWKKD